MRIKIVMFDKERWSMLSEDAHKICFKEIKPKSWDRIDFALGAIDEEKNQMVGYSTFRELDHESLYLQFGGTFPQYEGTLFTMRGYQGVLEWCRNAGYKRIVAYIENTNKRMLKIASHVGFLIIGVRNFKGKVLLEHGLEFTS